MAYPLIAYLALGAGLDLWQGRLLFPTPDHFENAVPSDRHIDFEDLRIPVGRDAFLHAWWIPSVTRSADQPTILVLHGNGYVIDEMVWGELGELRAVGANLLLMDYRGYGSSTALHPNEATVDEDADAALRYLHRERRAPLGRIFILGRSIGTGPATYLAERTPGIAGLILESPFTRIDDAATVLWITRIYPISLLLRSHFDNLSRIGSVTAPALIISGANDTLTPVWMAREIYARARGQKDLYIVPGAGHDNLTIVGGDALTEVLRKFIEGCH